MESLVQGKLARRVRWGGCRNVRSERNEARCVLTQSMRERLATLTRKCRHATAQLSALQTGMYLLGTTYNFCWPVRTVLPKRTSVRGWKVQGEYLDN